MMRWRRRTKQESKRRRRRDVGRKEGRRGNVLLVLVLTLQYDLGALTLLLPQRTARVHARPDSPPARAALAHEVYIKNMLPTLQCTSDAGARGRLAGVAAQNSPRSRAGMKRSNSDLDLWASKLNHLQPVQLILFQMFSTFLPSLT